VTQPEATAYRGGWTIPTDVYCDGYWKPTWVVHWIETPWPEYLWETEWAEWN
jgi:hypothetical protein